MVALMRDLIVKRSLKYIICLLGITIFITGGTYMSFADKAENHKDNGLFQGKDDDNSDGEDDEGTHNAGKNCLTSGCHVSGENKFYIGGTIYTSALGTSPRANATITVVDANGGKTTMSSDNIGNFYSGRSAKAPFSVSAYYECREVFMPTSASQGGCNADGCHNGISVGRIFISTNDLGLTGTVTDADTGNPILDARVSFSQNGKTKYRATTDAAGEFTMNKVKAGDYSLKITKSGYETYKQSYRMTQTNAVPLDITMNKK